MPEAFNGTVTVAQNDGDITITLNGQTGDATLGGNGVDGDINLTDSSGIARIRLNGSGNSISMYNASGQVIATLGSNGNLTLGGPGSDGDLTIRDNQNRTRLSFNGDRHRLRILTADGNQVAELGRNGNLTLGGSGMDGDLVLRDDTGADTISMNGQEGDMTLGGNGKDGDLRLRDSNGNNAIHLDGDHANLWMGGNGRDGDIVLFPASENNPAKDITKSTIHLNGDSGDIILRNADCAEEFTVANAVVAKPGDVMVLDEDGLLRPCATTFDKRAIGVISGADMYKPGIILDRQVELQNRHPIALVGKVCVRVTDENGPIRSGDLLTTSSKTGHAMAAGQDSRAFGTVIGKALANHAEGDGMIPIVIALQ
jgi:hypothetical protein